jgi:hypothetical protein
MIESISAITLATHDMARAVRFYTMVGFDLIRSGEDAAFSGCVHEFWGSPALPVLPRAKDVQQASEHPWDS